MHGRGLIPHRQARLVARRCGGNQDCEESVHLRPGLEINAKACHLRPAERRSEWRVQSSEIDVAPAQVAEPGIKPRIRAKPHGCAVATEVGIIMGIARLGYGECW